MPSGTPDDVATRVGSVELEAVPPRLMLDGKVRSGVSLAETRHRLEAVARYRYEKDPLVCPLQGQPPTGLRTPGRILDDHGEKRRQVLHAGAVNAGFLRRSLQVDVDLDRVNSH